MADHNLDLWWPGCSSLGETQETLILGWLFECYRVPTIPATNLPMPITWCYCAKASLRWKITWSILLCQGLGGSNSFKRGFFLGPGLFHFYRELPWVLFRQEFFRSHEFSILFLTNAEIVQLIFQNSLSLRNFTHNFGFFQIWQPQLGRAKFQVLQGFFGAKKKTWTRDQASGEISGGDFFCGIMSLRVRKLQLAFGVKGNPHLPVPYLEPGVDRYLKYWPLGAWFQI